MKKLEPFDEKKAREGTRILFEYLDELMSPSPLCKRMLQLLSITPATLESILSEFKEYEPDEVRECIVAFEKYEIIRKRKKDNNYVVSKELEVKTLLNKEKSVNLFHKVSDAINMYKDYEKERKRR